LPSNEIMAEQLANAASSLGYQNIVILYARDDFNRELAFLFEDAALKNDIKLVKRASFFDKDTNFRPIISQFNSEQFDSVFIAASGKTSALLVKQMREMGLEQPIIGSDSVNNQDYRTVAGEAANKTVFPITYSNLDSNNERNNRFIKKFKDKYLREPDYNAAQGYDSMMLLSESIERSNSTLTPTISSTLHFMPAWVGITGLHKFDQSGELLGKTYKFNAWNDDQIRPLPALHNIYLLERFNAANEAAETGDKDEKEDFASTFSTRMHEDDHKLQMLHLAYEALKFKKIGIIYEDNKIGRKKSGFNLLTALAKSKDIEIIGCKIPFSLIKKEQVDKKMIDCYGKLSLTIDAMLAPSVQNASPVLLHELSAGLAFFKIPAIGFETDNMDDHTSLAITRRTDVNKNTVSAYSGLLSGLKVHEFSTKIQGLPDIYVNMKDLQRMGRSEKEILLLSPDYFLESNDSEIGL
ncbi:MAG: ABC transporter substrate-binding protein, partial [Thiolinea sp.]